VPLSEHRPVESANDGQRPSSAAPQNVTRVTICSVRGVATPLTAPKPPKFGVPLR